MHALDVHVLTLASQQRMDAPIAKAPPLGGEAHHASAQCLPLATLVALVMEHRSRQPDQGARPSLRDPRLRPHRQIIGFLKQVEGGVPVKDLCRKHGFSDATFYKWRSRLGGLDVSEARRLRELEAENT